MEKITSQVARQGGRFWIMVLDDEADASDFEAAKFQSGLFSKSFEIMLKANLCHG